MNYATWFTKICCISLLVVSASDVTPTERWLNVWCIWHTFLETLQECRSRHLTGWIKPDFWETRVSRLFSVRRETKMPWCQSPSRKKKAVTTNAYQGQLNAGFSKVCEILKVCGIESLKYVQEFHTPVCYYGDISTHRNVTLNETKYDWLFDMSVKRPHGRALANETCHLFQTFQPSVWRSCYARLVYWYLRHYLTPPKTMSQPFHSICQIKEVKWFVNVVSCWL